MAACGRSLWDTPCGSYTRRDEPPGLAALPAQDNLRGQDTGGPLHGEKPERKRMKAAFQTTAPHPRKSRVSVGTVKSHCKIVSENGEVVLNFKVTPQSCAKLWLTDTAEDTASTHSVKAPTTVVTHVLSTCQQQVTCHIVNTEARTSTHREISAH